MFGELLLIALGTLASEDLTLAATGLLIAQGKLGFLQGVAACIAGIFTGDMLIYLAGRTFGLGARRWTVFARMVPLQAVERGGAWLGERGRSVVFLSRFTPGLRLPTYFAAGLLPTRMSQFAGYFLLAALIWAPLFVGITGWLGGSVLHTFFQGRTASAAAFSAVFALLLSSNYALRKIDHRRLAGFFKRKIRWEFWPPWAAYLPLLPYFGYLAIRHRSLTLFTAANPGIPSGGFVGESKSAILDGLPLAAHFEKISWNVGPSRRIARALEVVSEYDLPVVLKPDVGERGTGVSVVRSRTELEDYVEGSMGDIIIQKYAPGLEFGIFYYRYPHEACGRIFSITEKQFPHVTGDGQRTLRDLILADDRAVCQASTYFRLTKHDVESVPADGEVLQLVELGSHCRGAIFLDGSRYITPALEAAVDHVSQANSGFYFGRYDVRSASIETLRAGQFTVIELNGVSAEATHIYDPAVSFWSAYRTMFTQWRIAFEIGAANRRRGHEPMTLRAFIELIRHHRSNG